MDFSPVWPGALTVVTFGIRIPAGIFIPSLAAGAITGRQVTLCYLVA